MMNNPQVIVALNNISKISDGKRILTKLDLEIYDGESLSLQGSSSDGTSPLLRPDVAAKVAEAGYPPRSRMPFPCSPRHFATTPWSSRATRSNARASSSPMWGMPPVSTSSTSCSLKPWWPKPVKSAVNRPSWIQWIKEANAPPFSSIASSTPNHSGTPIDPHQAENRASAATRG